MRDLEATAAELLAELGAWHVTSGIAFAGPALSRRHSKRVTVDRCKATALLAYLVVAGLSAGERSHTRNALATLLWPEHSQSKASAAPATIV